MPQGRPQPRSALAALAGLPDVTVADVGQELGDLYDRYLHDAFVQVALGALAVVVLLWAVSEPPGTAAAGAAWSSARTVIRRQR